MLTSSADAQRVPPDVLRYLWVGCWYILLALISKELREQPCYDNNFRPFQPVYTIRLNFAGIFDSKRISFPVTG